MNKGIVIVVSAPSGGGKGTILAKLFSRNPNFKYSVSATTRSPRPGEVDGTNYFFTTKEKFQELIKNDMMLEYAEYCDNYYGTPKDYVKKMTDEGYDIFLEIDVQGGTQIKKKIPDCISIFITPPSLDVLRARLTGRGTETAEVIEKRLRMAESELPAASEYDYVVVNDNLDDAVSDIEAIIHAEKLKYQRNHEIKIFQELK